MMTRVGLAGLGLASPLGDEVDPAWRRLMAGDSAIRRHSFEGSADIAAATIESEVGAGLDKLQRVSTERVSRLALSAARHAVADAGLGAWPDPERVGIFLGTGMGGAATVDAAYAAFHAGRRMAPLTIPVGMFNSAAAVLAMHLDARGPVITYGVACASSALAIAEAAHALRRGDIDVAIAGGAEADLAPGTVAAWQSLRALAMVDEADPAGSCRPFSADRSGLVLGEGAAFVVMAREDTLLDRGRSPHAWLLGSAVRCDAAHLTTPAVRGQVSTIAAALRAGGVRADAVGYCNAHGTATLAGDPVECEALRSVFGESAPTLRVSSTKASHGHLLGAAGALEALWTVLALERGEVPPTRGVKRIDASCAGLRHILGEGTEASGLRCALSNSFAFGGTNVSLLFGSA